MATGRGRLSFALPPSPEFYDGIETMQGSKSKAELGDYGVTVGVTDLGVFLLENK